MFDIIPDVWTWSDPHSALEGLDLILNDFEFLKREEKELKILLPDYLDVSKKEEVRNYCGSSPVWRVPQLRDYYYSSIEKVKELPGIQVETVPSYTTKLMHTQPNLTRDCANLWKNPVERFVVSLPIFGTFPYKSDNASMGPWGQENKLTSFIFPLMIYKGCRKLGISGFDYAGPRFYDKSLTRHAFTIPDIDFPDFADPIVDAARLWAQDWKIYHQMEIESLVDSEFSALQSILQGKRS